MLKFDEVSKKIKYDLFLLIINSCFFNFLGALVGYGLLTSFSFIYVFIVGGAYLQTLLVEKEIFKYWNEESEPIDALHFMFALNFIFPLAFMFIFFNVNLIILISLILLINLISVMIFFKYYRGFVDCIIFQRQLKISKDLGGNKK